MEVENFLDRLTKMPTALKTVLQVIIVALLFGIVLGSKFQAISQTFIFDSDEGLNLIKAFLYAQGFSLYSQIWNDQPPLFTIVLAYWLKWFDWSVTAGRILVLALSTLLMWSYYQIIYSSLGFLPATIATLLLFTSWSYAQLSVSIMIGLPALALAMFSIYLVLRYKQQHRSYWLVLSGVVFACSLQIKLVTVFLIPIIILYAIEFKIRPDYLQRNWLPIARSLAIWLGSLLVIYLLIGLFSNQLLSFEQTIQNHLNQQSTSVSSPRFKEFAPYFDNVGYLRQMIFWFDRKYVFLAAGLGVGIVFLKRQWQIILPVVWLGVALLFFLRQKPIWYHYFPLLAIPVCWLAAYTIAAAFEWFGQAWAPTSKNLKLLQRAVPYLVTLGIALTVLITPTKPPFPLILENSTATQFVQKYKSVTQWMLTDRPIYAYRAGLKVPPETAVMSFKRVNSGSLAFKDLVAILQKYQPEQILFNRWTLELRKEPSLVAYLNTHYTKTYADEATATEHYVLKPVLKQLSDRASSNFPM